jgi:N-acyl-D-amino-acid deacylase
MCRRIELIRDYGLRTAEECIRSMTGGPAQSLGMKNRGLLKAGYAADICVLDYRNVRAASDYLYPFRKNKGLSYVLVNGHIAVRDGKSLGGYFGQVVCHERRK